MAHASGGPKSRTTRSGKRFRANAPLHGPQQEVLLATPESDRAAEVADTPEIIRRSPRRSIRQRPTCSDFGPFRRQVFGDDYHFCAECDKWDDLTPDAKLRISRSSRRFGCKADHKSCFHPTQLKKKNSRMLAFEKKVAAEDEKSSGYASDADSDLESEDSDSDLESEDSDSDTEEVESPYNLSGLLTASRAVPEATKAQAEIAELRSHIATLEETNDKLRKSNKYLRKRQRDYFEGNDDDSNKRPSSKIAAAVLDALDGVSYRFRRHKMARVGKRFVEAVWNYNGGALQSSVMECARVHYRDSIFTPFCTLKGMDLKGSDLSYSGIDVIHEVESGGEKYFRGTMPSPAAIKRQAAKIEWFARSKFPFKLRKTKQGEAIRFHHGKLLKGLVKAFHLEEAGKSRSLSIGFSIDGASWTKNMDVTIAGFRITDRAARDPLTKQLILHDSLNLKAQSRTLCIPAEIVSGKETKESFEESFIKFFKFMENIGHPGTLPEELSCFKCFDTMVCCDLSAGWKGLGKGGAAKQYARSCTCCGILSDLLSTPNATPCSRWCQDRLASDPNWQCYHKPIATPEQLAYMQTEVNELQAELEQDLEKVKEGTKMVLDDVDMEQPMQNSRRNPLSIHFVPETRLEKNQFSHLEHQ